MTAWVEGSRSFFLGAQAHLIDNEREVADRAWFADKLRHNPAHRYIVGRFVEAGSVNANKHLFNLEGLQMGRPTIANAPLNINHIPRRVIGAYVDAELIYPTGQPVEEAREVPKEKRDKLADEGKAMSDGSFPIETVGDLKNAIQAFGRAKNKDAVRRHIIKRAKALGHTELLPDGWGGGESAVTTGVPAISAQQYGWSYTHTTSSNSSSLVDFLNGGEQAAQQLQVANPHIEALAVVWKYYFPEEFAEVEMAHQEGRLFYSMECVPAEIKCSGDTGCGETYAYRGRQADTYCDHLNESASIKELIRPHFTGGAAVIPPSVPAWGDADVYALVAKHSELAENLYEQVKAETPHLTPAEWEAQMAALLAKVQ